MNAMVVYASKLGNTERIAKAIGRLSRSIERISTGMKANAQSLGRSFNFAVKYTTHDH